VSKQWFVDVPGIGEGPGGIFELPQGWFYRHASNSTEARTACDF
jgi:hypothetical protein